jgi:uncharacterized RDD family membrane protein YckC
MKCPKCSYLGFETGDRCKNCGYDFSLLVGSSPHVDADLSIRDAGDDQQPVTEVWFDRMDAGLKPAPERPAPLAEAAAVATASTTVARSAPVPTARDMSFPLFSPSSADDDKPLISLPAAPRPPLAVRRTPDTPRLRPFAQALDQNEGRLSLEVPDLSVGGPSEFHDTNSLKVEQAPEATISGLPRRAAAGLIDLAILFGIDVVIVYSTLRMSALTFNDWALLPAVPMLAFLLLLKLSYFGAFTAACGQTIGKMAMRIRVVGDDMTLDPGRAARRTLVSAISCLAVGTGFIPVFVDPEHRALHDRVAGTRVVELPSV